MDLPKVVTGDLYLAEMAEWLLLNTPRARPARNPLRLVLALKSVAGWT